MIVPATGCAAARRLTGLARLAFSAGFALVVVACGGGHGGGTAPPPTADVAPVITAQPTASRIASGATTTFTATASGEPAPSLAWQLVGGTDLVDGAGSGPLAGSTIAGATTGRLTLSNVPAGASGLQLRLTASNRAGSATSAAASLTVDPLVVGDLVSVAAGGSVSSADGSIRVTFPAGAVTADSTITVVARAAPSWPASADFAALQPVAGSFFDLRFTGGRLKPGVALEVTATPSRVHAGKRTPTGAGKDDPARALEAPGTTHVTVPVLECNGRLSGVPAPLDPDGSATAPGLLCDTDEASVICVGIATVIDIRDSVADFVATTDAPGNEWVVKTMNGAGGRAAVYIANAALDGSGGRRFRLGLLDGSARIATLDTPEAEVLALDPAGLLLSKGPGCTVVQSALVVHSSGASTLQPQWTSPPLVPAGASCPIDEPWQFREASYAPLGGVYDQTTATWTGSGWLVHVPRGPMLWWLSAANGQPTRSVGYAWLDGLGLPGVPSFVHGLVDDGSGNAWVLASGGAGRRCTRDATAAACLSLVRVAAGATTSTQIDVGGLRSRDARDNDAWLALDASGAVYVAATLTASRTNPPFAVRKVNADGSIGWTTALGFELKGGGVTVDGGRVLAHADGDGKGYLFSLDAATGATGTAVEWGGTASVGFYDPAWQRTTRLYSLDGKGHASVVGAFGGTLDGVGSGDGATAYARKFAAP